ncbi:Angiopoietin-related protein 4 [Stylophora pistillata]|uniref:Angiopoietin-related protein 4 n=1 Tax=Stylophora pistillata TaxID=50429 RepID=A0A2B4RFF5_STYPI|nr:Angiopoietin-related protein 4 [Stylophora pistillata]
MNYYLKPTNCAELYKDGKTTSGVYTIDPDGLGAFNVYCDQNTTGGGWTVIHKRLNGSVSFYQSWCKYKNSFGYAKDSFDGNNEAQFSTIDRGNTNCSKTFGAWWFPKDSDDYGYSNLSANCAELYKDGKTTSGVYTIDPDGLGAFNVYCDQNTTGGGWTVIHKRLNGSVSFYQSWCKYKNSFGDPNGEYWLGLDKMNRLTWRTKNTLRVDLEIALNRFYAEYDLFVAESELKIIS